MNRKRIECGASAFPEGIRSLIGDADVFDSSSSKEARVFFIDRDGGCYLKRAAAGTLAREARMTEFFHSLGLTAEPLGYLSADGYDYLLTRRVPGEDCTHPDYLADPDRLAGVLGEQLRALHGLNVPGSPGNDRNAAFIRSVRAGLDSGHYRPDHYFPELWGILSEKEAREEAVRGIGALRDDVPVHGDYCLPNVLLDGWRFSGFVDLGLSGMGDRHLDLMWGIWSLNYNLHTDRFTERFLDAYGRDAIEPEMLRRVAAMEMISV